MAELNFGLLNPPGSQSIGNAFVQGMDQAAVARAQENQNALAQYTLGKAKREDELTNKMLAGMQSATTLEQQAAVLRSVGRYKDASDLMNSDLERRYRLGQIEAQPGALLKNKADTAILHGNIMEREANAVVANPTSARAMQAVVNFGKATGQDVTQELKTLTELGDDPNKIAAWARGHALKGKDLAAFSTPKPTPTNVGDRIVFLDMNPNSPTFKSEVIPSQNIGAGPGTVPANTQAAVAVADAQDRGIPVPGVAPAQGTPAPVGAPVTPAAFPRITPQVQAGRTQDATTIKQQELVREQTSLAAAMQKLASQAAATDPGIRAFYEQQVKVHTDNIASLNTELGGRTNNMPGAAAVPNALIQRSPRDQRDTNVVASTTTDSAGNIRRFNKFGEPIGDVIKGAGKPSATYERNQALQKQLTQDLALTIRELESAVKPKGLIEQSTGSGAGALVDIGMGFFGSSTAGAQAVAALKPIYDRVLKIVPRFEGPQSNKDTQSYENAAGQLANPAVPNETKLVAAREILRLMKARQTQFISRDMVDLPNEPAGSTAPPTAPIDMPSAAAAEIARRAAAREKP